MPVRKKRDRLAGLAVPLIMIGPAAAFCLLFIGIPATSAIYGSLFDFGPMSRHWDFVGLGNFIELAQDKIFWTALRNNAIFIFGGIVVQVGVGTILAALLDRAVKRGNVVYRTIIFAPVVISSVAVSLIWLLLLDPNSGAVNQAVRAIGLEPPRLGWLGGPAYATVTIVLVGAWQYTGFIMILVLAGLQAIGKEIYEAAALDGARGPSAFFYMTLPLLRNVLAVCVLITALGAFKSFDLVYAMTQGGPGNATQVLGTYSFTQGFFLGRMGYADAISVVLLVMAIGLGWLQMKTARRS